MKRDPRFARLNAAAKANPHLIDRLLVLAEPAPVVDIGSAADAAAVLGPLLMGRDHEALAVLALNRRHRVLGTSVMTTGCDGFTIIDPRQILRWALLQGKSGAYSIIVAHNHPSGDSTPSQEDITVTGRLNAACKVLGVELLDHLIVTDEGKCASVAGLGHIK